jgi:hypothetical protein
MLLISKVIDTKWYQDYNSYGIAPWTVRMDVVFEHDGQRNTARLDHVLRQWLGQLTEARRTAIHDARPEMIKVFSRNYENPYSSSDKRIIYTICKGDIEAWAKRAKTLLAQTQNVC